jgi:hypothetical protein
MQNERGVGVGVRERNFYYGNPFGIIIRLKVLQRRDERDGIG